MCNHATFLRHATMELPMEDKPKDYSSLPLAETLYDIDNKIDRLYQRITFIRIVCASAIGIVLAVGALEIIAQVSEWLKGW